MAPTTEKLTLSTSVLEAVRVVCGDGQRVDQNVPGGVAPPLTPSACVANGRSSSPWAAPDTTPPVPATASAKLSSVPAARAPSALPKSHAVAQVPAYPTGWSRRRCSLGRRGTRRAPVAGPPGGCRSRRSPRYGRDGARAAVALRRAAVAGRAFSAVRRSGPPEAPVAVRLPRSPTGRSVRAVTATCPAPIGCSPTNADRCRSGRRGRERRRVAALALTPTAGQVATPGAVAAVTDRVLRRDRRRRPGGRDAGGDGRTGVGAGTEAMLVEPATAR